MFSGKGDLVSRAVTNSNKPMSGIESENSYLQNFKERSNVIYPDRSKEYDT